MKSVVFFFFLLLLSPSSQDKSASQTAIKGKQEAFLRCLEIQHSVPSDLIFPSATPNFTALFLSSVQNHRILSPNSFLPLLIITPTARSHVQSSLSCCRHLSIAPKIRSGGHDFEGLSSISTITPFFVVLDLRHLRSISVDDACDSAWVESGATLGELYYALAMACKGAAFPAGSCPTVGVGGHFSAGGVGTLVRAHGLAIDNVVDARIVTASGDVLGRESMGEDLFWAIRGGGAASFGVILSYKIKLVHLPNKVTIFTERRTMEDGAIKVIAKWQQIAHKLDSRLFIQATLLAAKKKKKKKKTIEVTFNALFLGGKNELLSITEEFFPEIELKADDCRETSWIESVLQFANFPSKTSDPTALLDRSSWSAMAASFKSKSDFLTEPIEEEAWESIFRFLAEGEETPMLQINPFGGRMDEISATETPFPRRKGSLYDLLCLVSWKEEEEEEEEAQRHMKWMERYYDFMSAYVSKDPRGAYLNGRDLQLGINGGGKTSYEKASEWGFRYFDGNFRRLAQVKTKVDPSNLFRDEQSIPLLS